MLEDRTASAAAGSNDVLTDIACSRESLKLANAFPSLAVTTVDQHVQDMITACRSFV